MYFPYFRGKQFDLLTIRENSAILAGANFKPIIEPVRGSFSPLTRALDAVLEDDGKAIVIVNPEHGELSSNGKPISKMLEEKYLETENISAGILLRPETGLTEAMECFEAHSGHTPVFVHSGFTEGRALATELSGQLTKDNLHVFVEGSGVKLQAKHFRGSTRILLRDGFKRRKNKDYPKLEPFSDLHVTYQEEGMDGFGDFLIVGDEYAEGGGLPLVLAIHLTFIDSDQDDLMQIYHFKSKLHATQGDPAGKFAEALEEMIKTLDSKDSKVYETEAVEEFRDLHRRGHFPGLGYIKKLSMSHHIQTYAQYLSKTT